MESRVVEQLLERYFEGETSLQEEQQLKAYFQQETIAEQLEAYRPLFVFFSESKQEQLDISFDQKILAQIAVEKPAKIRRLRVVPMLARIAAMLVLAISAWWFYQSSWEQPLQEQAIDWSQYEPASAEEALQIYKTAISRVSKELKSGATTAVREVENVQELGKFIK